MILAYFFRKSTWSLPVTVCDLILTDKMAVSIMRRNKIIFLII